MLQRLGERALFGRIRGDIGGLNGYLFEQITRGHQAIFHTLAHVGGYLIENARRFAQARQIICKVFAITERNAGRQAGEI